LTPPNNDIKRSISLLELIPIIVNKLPEKLPALVMGGIPTLLQKDSDVNSIGKVMEENAVRFRNKTAILFESEKLTHHELNALVNQYAYFLYNEGVRKGDVVVVFLENRPETLYLTAALAKIGAVASLINSNQRSRVLLHSINLKNDGFYVVGEELLDAFQEISGQVMAPGRKVFIGISDKCKVSFPDYFIDAKSRLKFFPRKNFPGAGKILSGTPFAYVFTSGTTGMPKASIQTHRKWISCMNWFGRINLGLNSDDVIYVSIPYYHSNALLIAWSSAAVSGAAMAIRRKFSASEFWPDAIRFGATSFIYIGDICRYLMNTVPSDLDKKHQVRKIIGNGMRPDIWNAFKERFNIPEIYEFYASSEGNTTFTNTLNIDCSVGWCASPFSIVQYDMDLDEPVRDKNGYMIKVKKGEVGLMISEINDRFPFPGYVDPADNDKKIFRDVFTRGDAWFNTGDIMRDIGFRHTQFVDRVGDTFRWKGENVATAEVEEIINAYPAVAGSAVYGVQVPHTDGRAGMAAIQLREGYEMDWTDFSAYLKDELPSYAIPLFIRVVEDFEYTSTYKVRKNKLKREGFRPLHPDDLRWIKPGKDQPYELLSAGKLEEIKRKGI